MILGETNINVFKNNITNNNGKGISISKYSAIAAFLNGSESFTSTNPFNPYHIFNSDISSIYLGSEGVYLNLSGIYSVYSMISDNIVSDNGEYGILVLDSENLWIRNNVFSGNGLSGVLLSGFDGSVLSDNVFIGNGVGVSLDSSNGNNIFNNSFIGNVAGIDVGSNDNNIILNVFSNCTDDIVLRGNRNIISGNKFFNSKSDSISVYGYQNTIKNNKINNSKGYGVYLGSSNNIISNNDFVNIKCVYVGSDNNSILLNSFSGGVNGIIISGVKNVIRDNSISNTKSNSVSVYGYKNTIKNNKINNSKGYGISLFAYGNNVTYNSLINNYKSLYIDSDQNVFSYNNIIGSKSDGLTILGFSNVFKKKYY
ncbi:NosD domain-containing protein [Methanobrevibacter arboriphilus]|uniref:NosD domain-containing protein n=1 Tax=Methanobrevibacter arboriphilus TaxID=39441 RepID=UPI0006D22C88|nr:right-handed parallel beta-helix repeat-containing protein [Methanobrevibacter arboriphilus]